MGTSVKRGRNEAFLINGIKMIMAKNYHAEMYEFDIHAEIDRSLSYSENFNIIFDKLRKRGLIVDGIHNKNRQ